MEILLFIAAVILICAGMFLKGKAWNSFVDDVTKNENDSNRKKDS